jgi:hypothetical protein
VFKITTNTQAALSSVKELISPSSSHSDQKFDGILVMRLQKRLQQQQLSCWS